MQTIAVGELVRLIPWTHFRDRKLKECHAGTTSSANQSYAKVAVKATKTVSFYALQWFRLSDHKPSRF
jgi:hypothetical protein